MTPSLPKAKGQVRRTRLAMQNALQGSCHIRPSRTGKARDNRIRGRTCTSAGHPGEASAHDCRQGIRRKAYDAP